MKGLTVKLVHRSPLASAAAVRNKLTLIPLPLPFTYPVHTGHDRHTCPLSLFWNEDFTVESHYSQFK